MAQLMYKYLYQKFLLANPKLEFNRFGMFFVNFYTNFYDFDF